MNGHLVERIFVSHWFESFTNSIRSDRFCFLRGFFVADAVSLCVKWDYLVGIFGVGLSCSTGVGLCVVCM